MAPPSSEPGTAPPTALIVIDHGSRREAANELVIRLAQRLAAAHPQWIAVEPAHMELAEPDLATAAERCLAQGARRIVVQPLMLGPGRHVTEDIPALTRAVASRHEGVEFHVGTAIGEHDGIIAALVDGAAGATQKIDNR